MNTEIPDLSDTSSYESSDPEENNKNWQEVPMKRKNTGSHKIFEQKRPHYEQTATTSNRFVALATDKNNVDINIGNTQLSSPKPPPIFFPVVEDIGKMVSSLCKFVKSSEFHYKSLRDGQVRLSMKTAESYRTIIKYLDECKIKYHTFQMKSERAFRAVIKNLHHTTSVSDIKAMLLSLGHQVRSVRNIVSRTTKKPLPMFHVDLDPSDNNKEIFNIRSFGPAIIQVEPPKKIDEMPQCFRCQDYGHTKTYCRREFRCVKCSLNHPTKDCRKSEETPPTCVHCKSNHTANYKGCSIYKTLMSKRYNTNRNVHKNGQ